MKQSGLLLGLIVGIVVVGGASVGLASHYLSGHSSIKGSDCSVIKRHLRVVIRNNQLSPVTTQGQLCDSLTITNDDFRVREIAFGPHDHHVAYDGVLEKLIGQGQSLTVTLNQPGNFSFHDHISDSLVGYFSVSAN